MIGWPGNTLSVWTFAILDLIIACSPNFAPAWSRAMLNSVCWICSWSAVGRGAGGTAHGRQRTDSTHVLARMRALNRTLCVAQTMVYVLNVLSEVAPDWVRTHVPVEWVERYGERLYHERLPKEEEERKQYAHQVGTDGWLLLSALEAPATPDPIENTARYHHAAHQSSSNNLNQESREDDGGQNQLYLPLSSSTPPMTLTRAMARRGPPSGSDIKCILPRRVMKMLHS